MPNKKITRRALLTSMLSLLLCFAMLVGTTFAWFTDSVTSANNIIKSGILDVELTYSDDNQTWSDASQGAISRVLGSVALTAAIWLISVGVP